MRKIDKILAFILLIGIFIMFFGGLRIAAGPNGDMENAYYFSQIVSSIMVVFSLFVALMQYSISSEEQVRLQEREIEVREHEILELETARVQKAIDLANYYKDNILSYVSILDSVYTDCGIKKILESVDKRDMIEFDIYEVEKLLSLDKRNAIQKIVKSKEFLDAFAKNSIIYGYAKSARQVIVTKDKDGKDCKEIKFDYMELANEYGNIINQALNNTEYFAMNFIHETADESVVYQSLHKTYLELMSLLYFDISVNNNIGEEKFYTNAIELFNKWKDKAEQQKNGILEMQRASVEKGTMLSFSKSRA